MKTITVYDDTAKILERMADKEDTTIAEIVEELILDSEEHAEYIPMGERR